MVDPLEPVELLQQLVDGGTLSDTEAAHAQALQDRSREPLDRVLAQSGLMSEADIATFYGQVSGLAFATSRETLQLPDGLEPMDADVNPDFLRGERILPLGTDGASVIAGVVDPQNLKALQGLSFACRRPVTPVVLTQGLFDQLSISLDEADEAGEREHVELDLLADSDRLRDLAQAGPVIRALDQLVARAVEAGASDIHVELQQREAVVRCRVDGILRQLNTWPSNQALAVISRVKVLADLDIAERRRPQDGRFSVPIAGRSVDVRVSVVPGQYGESLVLRLLDPELSLRDVADLGFSDVVAGTAGKVLAEPHGLVLVTGPTGSGKTTSLYAFLRHLANGERKILTIEDPIEYRLAGVGQSQINPAIGISFAEALRSFLRHDPDVVMVGEIRDAETAHTAVQAAMTGHLVLSTLHTNDAPSAITRLQDLGVADFLIASTLAGVFGQRLVRRLCTVCAGAGCEACGQTGFRGRVPVVEAFHVDESMRAAIRQQSVDAEAVSRELANRAFRTMWQDGLQKCAAGLTCEDELKRTLSQRRGADG
ncbi:GspE/PulE family protein [Maricaulis sp.]|uniref:GspE/PulE family protein n=1 Tax=Maricaulis sp. TaxID=1486257 RepID=UPI001B2084B5|nr:GspE/PulE family protein [Maricaulis sp.]MBO6797777.1 type II/IV secretion system protein [Maricaulis sp.]